MFLQSLLFTLILSIFMNENNTNDMDYYKEYGNYYEKKMVAGVHLKFIVVENVQTYQEILDKESSFYEKDLSKEYGYNIHRINDVYLVEFDAHKQYAFFVPAQKVMLFEKLSHIFLFIKKGENNFVLFENYWASEFDKIIRNNFDLSDFEIVKIHKNRLSKLYYSKKVNLFFLISCTREDLQSKKINAGSTMIFDNLEDVKKARFYEDS